MNYNLSGVAENLFVQRPIPALMFCQIEDATRRKFYEAVLTEGYFHENSGSVSIQLYRLTALSMHILGTPSVSPITKHLQMLIATLKPDYEVWLNSGMFAKFLNDATEFDTFIFSGCRPGRTPYGNIVNNDYIIKYLAYLGLTEERLSLGHYLQESYPVTDDYFIDSWSQLKVRLQEFGKAPLLEPITKKHFPLVSMYELLGDHGMCAPYCFPEWLTIDHWKNCRVHPLQTAEGKGMVCWYLDIIYPFPIRKYGNAAPMCHVEYFSTLEEA